MIRRRILVASLTISIAVVVSLLALEIILRFLPVHDGFRTLAVNDANPILRYTPNRVITWSRHASFSMVNRTRINDRGFINDQDYEPDAPGPLLAVIGDSFVEAAMMPYADTLHGRLAARLASAGRVYSFGTGGA